MTRHWHLPDTYRTPFHRLGHAARRPLRRRRAADGKRRGRSVAGGALARARPAAGAVRHRGLVGRVLHRGPVQPKVPWASANRTQNPEQLT